MVCLTCLVLYCIDASIRPSSDHLIPYTNTNTYLRAHTRTHRYETEGVEGGDWHDITKKEAREAAMEAWKDMTKVGVGVLGGRVDGMIHGLA